MGDLVMAKGWRVAAVQCQQCAVVVDRAHHVGQQPPLYCGARCQRAAKRLRRSRGALVEPAAAKPRSTCPGCQQESRVASRGGFVTCQDCRVRLHGACMRKTPYGSEGAAAAFAAAHGLDQYPYRCALCELWHVTSVGTPDAMPGDDEFGVRMRAAGFQREAVR